MRLALLILALPVVFLFSSCDGSRERAERYDRGYEAAWEGEEASSFWATKEEKDGYEAGLDDVWTYDTGYYDGYEEKQPKYFNDPLYMEAYKDGKKDKERRR